jgi:putative tricarboxylic transport membrane protein
MTDILNALGHMLTVGPLFWLLLGTVLGIVVGAVPGLTGAMLIALTIPLTGDMSAADAMILLVSMYVGSISGGLITATLLRMPGTPASIITTLDGYPLTQQGKPARALGLGINASFIGGLVSWVFLVTLAYPVSRLSMYLGPWDMFALVMVAMVMMASVSGNSLRMGMLSGMLGILARMPGESQATGQIRWTGGWSALDDGLGLLPVLIGLFAVSQVLKESCQLNRPQETATVDGPGLLLSRKDWRDQRKNMARSSLLGTWIGVLPGIGANIGSVVAYSAAQSASKNPEEFGHGAEEGVVASEAANNATVGGALIPLVAMGIPGSVIDAILLGALMMHELTPGPGLFTDQPQLVWTIMLTMLLANIVMFAVMLIAVRWIARLVNVPRYLLLPVIVVFCVVGAYALKFRMFHVAVMLAFGVLGFGLERLGVPLAPFVIGFVLAPVAEKELGQGLQASGGSWLPLVTHPVALLFTLASLYLLVRPILRRRKAASG